MAKQVATFMLVCILVGMLVSGCTAGAAQPTPDTAATINAAVAATAAGAAQNQALIDTAVAATTTARPPTVITATPMPLLPSPTPVASTSISEEELAAIIDTAVAEAVNASTEANTAAEQASSDGAITAEEAAMLEYYLGISNDDIDQALTLAEDYLALYGELTDETIQLMTQVEQDLTALETNAQALSATLEEVNNALVQGQAVSQELVVQLQTQTQQASAALTDLQTKSQGWSDKVKTELDTRAANAAHLAPDQVASDRAGALQQLQGYVEAVQKGLQDGKISQGELDQIAQLSANAAASLKGSGGVELSKFADSVSALTEQLARGELPAAKLNLGSLKANIPTRLK